MPTAYVTAPPDAAEDLATALVDRRVAACVNRIDCKSTFRWDGGVQHEAEVILLAKTTEERYDDLVAAVEELHPYDVPCIERFDESHVLEAFGQWRDDCVSNDG
jgi:periplasmic divalent cation tolerance protein